MGGEEEDEKLERTIIYLGLTNLKKIDLTSYNHVVKKQETRNENIDVSISDLKGLQEEICLGAKKQFSDSTLPHSRCISLLEEQI